MKLFEKIANKILNFFIKKDKNLYFEIKLYKYNNYSIEQFINFLESFTESKYKISFIINGNTQSINFYIKVPKNIEEYFIGSFYTNFPESEIKKTKNIKYKIDKFIYFDDIDTTIKDININNSFKDILSLWSYIDENNDFCLSYNINYNNGLINKIKSILNKKYNNIDNSINLNIGFSLKNKKYAIIENNIKNIFAKILNKNIKITKYKRNIKLYYKQFTIFFHLLNKDTIINNLNYIEYKKLPYPKNLPSKGENINILGVTDYKNINIKFGMKEDDKFRHCYIIGKTGMGKSTLISNMVIDDIKRNKGVCVIDPHGDLIDNILYHIPSSRINDVILFDVSDFNYPIGFNIFQYENEEEKNILVSGIVATFKKLYENSWGPRLEYILRNSLLAIIEYPNATLLHLTRMLTDKNFLIEVLNYVDDPIVLKFFNKEFLKWNDNFRNEAISPIINKVGQFLSSPIIRNIFGQSKTKLDIKKIMNEEKILLINLSKGKIGEDNANMIGSFFVTKIQIDTMAKANINFNNRKPFYLYIDEFQNFATDSFENILSEARKYKLSLIIANQYINQISENIQNAIFGNVGTIISFGVGYEDSQLISKQFKELILPNDILSLPKFTAYIKLMINGVISDPFSMKTLSFSKVKNGVEIKEKIIKQTQQSYAIKKDIIEKKIKIWAENSFSLTDKAISESKKDIKNKEVIKSIKGLKKDIWYDGIIKLKYNYGVFIVLNGGKIEGLLHKNKMKIPEGIKRKDYYNIGDKIKVKFDKIKNNNGESIEFTQL